MNICFYNLAHIGDVYSSASFIRLVCNSNADKQFYYYFILGDIFLKDVKNIKRIDNFENHYSSNLVNGHEPEKLINSGFHYYIQQNIYSHSPYNILNVNGQDYLFVNTWCSAMRINDFDYSAGFTAWPNLIEKLNYEFHLDINLNPIKRKDLVLHVENNEFTEVELSSIAVTELNDTIFVFNYVPRSVSFNMNELNNYILKLSATNKVLVSTYDALFDNNMNVSFFDIKFNIKPDPFCTNIIKLWKIAKLCKKIILLPTGSSWTFLHEIDYIKEDKLYMYGNHHYCNLLNDNICFLFDIPNCIKNI